MTNALKTAPFAAGPEAGRHEVSTQINPELFREVMGQYPTGVVVITATSADGTPLGMTVGSFTSVSLDPCMVAFLPDRASGSWRALRESGTSFGVNILAADQEWICRQVAVRKQDKFAGIPWRPSPHGNPQLDGCVAFIDCETEAIHDAGDHHIVVGAVQSASTMRPANSLLFFQGGYGSFRPRSLAAGAPGLHEQLRYIDVARPIMDSLASRTRCEISAMALADGELVTAATAGPQKALLGATRVGHRVPFMPPVGAVYAAWADERARGYWLQGTAEEGSTKRWESNARMLDRIRERGYGFALGHEVGAAIEVASAQHTGRQIPEDEFRLVIGAAESSYNPPDLDPEADHEFHAATVPVFHPDRSIAFTLTLWGPDGEISHEGMSYLIGLLKEAGEAATQALAVAERI